METTKIIIGLLLIGIIATGTYVIFKDDAKFRVDIDKSTYYTKNNYNRWVVSGREYNSLWAGTTKLNRDLNNTKVETIINDIITITRHTEYQRGPIITDYYVFDSKEDSIEKFPLSHKIEIINGGGLIYQYEVRDLDYDGITKTISGTSMSFGKGMKVVWDDNYYWAKVYASGILKVRYHVATDYEVFEARLFDPPVITQITPTNGSNVTYGQPTFSFNISEGGNYNCSLLVNSSLYGSSTNLSNETNTNSIISNTTITVGNWNWAINCTNGTNTNISAYWDFTIINNQTTSLCSYVSQIYLVPNMSYYNYTTGAITQYNITAYNSSECGYTYATNIYCVLCDYQALINATLGANFELYYNNTLMNTSWQTIIENATNGTYYFNVTGSYLNASTASDSWTDSFQVV